MTEYTVPQQQVFRAVFGAVKNAQDGHPDWPLDKTMAQSIAKRATGTLTAMLPDVLAARAPSDKAKGSTTQKPACVWTSGFRRTGKGAPLRASVKAGKRRSQLRRLHAEVSAMVRPAKDAGQTERVSALIDVLRLIAKLREAA